MNDIYQSPEFLNAMAAGVVVLILLVFLLKYPFRKTPEWTLSQHYMYLNACIKSSQTIEQLNKYRPEIDKFFDKHFVRDTNNCVLKRYYKRLLESISEKENEFNAIEKATA